MEQAIKAPRTAHTARPVTSSSGRFVRLGTASMLSSPDQFINLARLDFQKYAKAPNLSKPLFEYIFYHENDMRNALQLAAAATEEAQFKDWWWKIQLGKCYYRYVQRKNVFFFSLRISSKFRKARNVSRCRKAVFVGSQTTSKCRQLPVSVKSLRQT
jgi:hypothetical protein